MDILQAIDSTVFHWINVSWGNRFFDFILPLWREKWIWTPFYLFLVVFVLQNWRGRRGLIILLGLVAVIGLSDFTSSTLLKKNIRRLRPCNNPEMQDQLVRRVDCGSGYSFTSSHAANHFSIAIYLSILFGYLSPWIRPALISWAFVVAYAQVYVGVHYPGDVLVGGILGALIARFVASYIKPIVTKANSEGA